MWRFVGTYEYLLTFRHMMKMSGCALILQLARRYGSVTRRDVVGANIHTQALSRLVRVGQLERIAPGQYRIPDTMITERHSLAVVAAAAPRSVVCLLSALSFHQIGTQLPYAVWIAIDRRARPPALDYPPLTVVRFGGLAFTEGVETHQAEGRSIRVYSVAKTIADLFKYRNKLGLEVAIEALRDSWHTRQFTMAEILRYARVCRVERIMTPYLEVLAS
jgi:predicted transcriptional regulator of viral defense system